MSEKSVKSVIILTNFWDAAELIRNKQIIISHNEDNYRITLDPKRVRSISLSTPILNSKEQDLSLVDLDKQGVERLDFFCPTYNTLKKYHKDNDWKCYVDKYKGLMRIRKSIVRDWIENIPASSVTILCCWEILSESSHCHREILHRAFNKSSFASERVISILRNGTRKRVCDIMVGQHQMAAEDRVRGFSDDLLETDVINPYMTYFTAPANITMTGEIEYPVNHITGEREYPVLPRPVEQPEPLDHAEAHSNLIYDIFNPQVPLRS